MPMKALHRSPSKKTTKELPVIEIHGQTLPVELRINKRAKRIILKVDPFKQIVHLTCPHKRSYQEAIDFARQRKDWIAQRLAEAPPNKPFINGAHIPIRNIPHLIIHDPNSTKGVRQTEASQELMIGGDVSFLARRLTDFLRREAKKDLTAYTDQFCAQLNKDRRRISIRDTKTRWGSCSSDGTLNYSWRLILAPQAVLRYVAAHEAAHLVHMDHSPAFWKVVDSLIEDRKEAQNWLKDHGTSLHSYGPP